MQDILNNRELAVAVWLFILMIVFISRKSVRCSVWNVIKAFFTPWLIIPLIVSFIPALMIIILLAKFNLWDVSVLKETIYWVIGTGFVMFAGVSNVSSIKDLFKKTSKDTLKLIIVLEFFIGLYVFPLWIELFIIPFIWLLVIVSTVAEYQKGKEYEMTKKFLSGLTVVAGLAVLFFATIAFINNPRPLFSYQSLELFLLPIALSFVYFPSVYLLALYSKYELLFKRIDMFLGHVDGMSCVKLACMKRCGFSVVVAGEMIRYLVINLTHDTTRVAALKLVKEFTINQRS